MKNFNPLALALLLPVFLGCQNPKNARHSTVTNAPPIGTPALPDETIPQPALRATLPAIHQDGRFWADEQGQRLRLRGTNIGNWLQLEFWMMNSPMSTNAGAIGDQCTLENELERRFGPAEKERLMAAYRDSWITTRDWDNMQSMGLNVVRLPFMYNLIEDQYNPYHLRPDAWIYLDRAIDEAEKRGMYTILDLHGAVGSQGWEHHSGCAGKNELWGSPEFRNRTKWLWTQIANRYKDRNAVAGFGLINEPWGTDAQTLANFSRELYEVIRTVDTRHVVILPGHNAAGIDAYGDPASRGMKNVAFEMHFYPGFWGWGEGQDPVEVHREWLFCGTNGTGGVCDWNNRLTKLNTPFLVGEFQPWTALGSLGASLTRATYDVYNSMGWAATSWAYKTASFAGSDGSQGWGWGMTTNHASGGAFGSINISQAGKNEIENYFRAFAKQKVLVNEDLRFRMNNQTKIGNRIEAENFNNQSGINIEKSNDTDGGLNVGFLDAQNWMSYSIHVPVAGLYRIQFRVASPTGGRIILGRDGKDIIAADVPNTGGWQSWRTVEVQGRLEAGPQDLSVWVDKGGWNFNWWSLEKID